MSAYVIAQVNITNELPYKEYVKQTSVIVKKYQGEFIVRGGKFIKMIGNWDFERTVIIKFPTYDTALKWYNSEEYKPIKKIREENSKGNLIIVDGV